MKKNREMRGLKGGIVSLLFISGFLVLPGEWGMSVFGGSLPPFVPVDVSLASPLTFALTGV